MYTGGRKHGICWAAAWGREGACGKTYSVSTPLLTFAVCAREMEAAFAFPFVGQYHAWGKQRLDSRSRVAFCCKSVVLRSPCLTSRLWRCVSQRF